MKYYYNIFICRYKYKYYLIYLYLNLKNFEYLWTERVGPKKWNVWSEAYCVLAWQ